MTIVLVSKCSFDIEQYVGFKISVLISPSKSLIWSRWVTNGYQHMEYTLSKDFAHKIRRQRRQSPRARPVAEHWILAMGPNDSSNWASNVLVVRKKKILSLTCACSSNSNLFWSSYTMFSLSIFWGERGGGEALEHWEDSSQSSVRDKIFLDFYGFIAFCFSITSYALSLFLVGRKSFDFFGLKKSFHNGNQWIAKLVQPWLGVKLMSFFYL